MGWEAEGRLLGNEPLKADSIGSNSKKVSHVTISMTQARPGLDEVLELDRICLRDSDGEPLDTVAHRGKLEQSIPRSRNGGRFIEMVNLSPMLTYGR